MLKRDDRHVPEQWILAGLIKYARTAYWEKFLADMLRVVP